jgi:hypothetical protein
MSYVYVYTQAHYFMYYYSLDTLHDVTVIRPLAALAS